MSRSSSSARLSRWPPRVDEVVDRLRAAGCVFAEDEASVLRSAASGPDELERLLARRVRGEPLEVVVGFADFHGVRVRTAPGVFVPRTRTALLVDVALQHLAADSDRSVVLDLCCGTGAVGLAVLAGTDRPLTLVASDVDPDAVACARRNVEPAGGAVVASDLFTALPRGLRGQVDVLTCNAPYVPSEAVLGMPPEARDHEALVALDGGPDGLDVVRRVLAEAPDWLGPGGVVAVEVAAVQEERALVAARGAGLEATVRTEPGIGGRVLVATGRPRTSTPDPREGV